MSKQCKNCKKPLSSEGLDFCSLECAEAYKGANKPEPEEKRIDPTIEAVLKYMGIEKENFTKDVAYRHWERFVRFIRDNSGKSWNDFLRPRLRSYVGIDYRYLDDYLESCLSWGIVKLVDGNVIFVGLPKKGVE